MNIIRHFCNNAKMISKAIVCVFLAASLMAVVLCLYKLMYVEARSQLRIRNATEVLRTQLQSIKQNNDGSLLHQHYIKGHQEALAALGNLPNHGLSRPMLVSAELNQTTTPQGKRWFLGLAWLEDGYSVHGFYLVDQEGSIDDFPNSLDLSHAEMEFYARTAWRDMWVPVVTSQSDRAWEGSDSLLTPVQIDIDNYGNEEIQFGLLTEHGRESSRVPVFVNRNDGGPDCSRVGAGEASKR